VSSLQPAKENQHFYIRKIRACKEHKLTGILKDIKIRVSFTGKIRLSKDFIQELYVHQGFQKPSAFKTVIDLKFEDGRIMESNDRSKEVAAIRGRFKEGYETTGLIKRIKDAFSLDMDLK